MENYIYPIINEIEFCNAVIAVIDYCNDGNMGISRQKGFEIAGNWWPEVGNMLMRRRVASFQDFALAATQPFLLLPVREECQCIISAIKAERKSNIIDMIYKIAGIGTGTLALVVSVISLLIDCRCGQ